MEKLQAALDKARESRTGTAPRAKTPKVRAGKPGQSERDALWAALKPLDLDAPNLEMHRLVTREAGLAATPFDILRTKVFLQMRQNGWKRLAITSPMPNSGKSTTACNLALGLGRQKDLRSIILDLDLRSPSVHELFGTKPERSIGDVLSGEVDFADQALRIGDNVAVSMARDPDKDPTRTLLSEGTAEVIESIEATYKPDIMIFDLPSVLVNDDTRAFLKNVDCALIVVRANATRYNQFDTCEREIAEHTNVLGVVLNAVVDSARSKSE
ncbi:CpsD/CapB family tyrosine-protein kinase [Celeribacter arenosi]|uniref:CpsD/CapB family tyrosine-protein kinase n=1 Tax=Celeribacter arenosi TaxID=792649 RepID=A0ABP7K6F9_9RHOB